MAEQVTSAGGMPISQRRWRRRCKLGRLGIYWPKPGSELESELGRNTMAKLVFGAGLLFALVNLSVPLRAQTVSLSVCNAGKVDIDVFLSQPGKVSSSHIGSADCAKVAETKGSMPPAYVGFAFVDSQKQWGAARRLELLPDLGL